MPEKIKAGFARNLLAPTDLTVAQVRFAFYNRILNGVDRYSGRPFKRFVAQAEWLKYDGEYDSEYELREMKLFIPKSPDDDFQLVLSLCDDGTHRLVLDYDRPAYDAEYWKKFSPAPLESYAHGTDFYWMTPSTTNFHLYGHHSMPYEGVRDTNAKVNPEYAVKLDRRGFAAARPPWLTKSGEIGDPFDDSFKAFRSAEFLGFSAEDFVIPEPEQKDDGKTGWDDLFGDDDA